jgi:N-acetylglutamate synthase-like GNAT family acetyltransferase
MTEIRHVGPGEPAVREFLERRGNALVVRNGEVFDATGHPAVVAEEAGALIGVITYDIVGTNCEISTLFADEKQWSGVGTALVAAVAEIAHRAGCKRYWVVTTNDNVDGLRFYQRRGFRLAQIRPGAVDETRRTVKPQIPLTGNYGIPLRDEIELEQTLPWEPPSTAKYGNHPNRTEL